MKDIYVYIAGPYTKDDPVINVRNAMEAANRLIDMGYCVFCPHLSHFLHMASPKKYDTWLRHDFMWLRKCDCVLRLSGESKGADEEVELAKSLGKEIVFSVEEFYDKR